MRFPSTRMTSSPTSRWLTRAGGGVCAEGPTDSFQPITWRFGHETTLHLPGHALPAKPVSLEEKGLPCSFSHLIPLVSPVFSPHSLYLSAHHGASQKCQAFSGLSAQLWFFLFQSSFSSVPYSPLLFIKLTSRSEAVVQRRVAGRRGERDFCNKLPCGSEHRRMEGPLCLQFYGFCI